MTTAFSVWIKAQGIYALLMLPTLLLPPMFIMAEMYAWLWGIPALFLFYGLLILLKKKQLFSLPLLICSAFLLTLFCTYGAAWHFASFQNPWKEFLEWIMFPAAGCGAAIAAVILSRKSMRRYILNEDEIELIDLETNLQMQKHITQS
jgi:hypothetical protein